MDISQVICKNLDLGIPRAHFVGVRGISHRKFKIVTDKGTFFVKGYEGMSDKELRYLHELEVFMLSKSIPASIPVNVTGPLWIRLEKVAYKPYYFVESNIQEDLSRPQYYDMGVMLAKIHKASQQGMPPMLFKRQASFPGVKETLKAFDDFLKRIEEKNILEKDVVATQLHSHIQWKMNLTQQFKGEPQLINDTITHGDFHPHNIIFDSDKKISAVCDWDRAGFGSRILELVSSVFLSCFRLDIDDAKAFEFARAMISGYHSEYPISRAEFEQGLRAFSYTSILNTMTENTYFSGSTFSVTNFIAVERRVIELSLDDSLLEKLLNVDGGPSIS